MLGRKDYTREELDHARAAIEGQLAAYRHLVEAVHSADADPTLHAALERLEPLLSNSMTLVLDRYFVHRLRGVAGKDGNPLNEVELLADSLINNGADLRGNNVVKYKPEASVLGLELGERISLDVDQFERLATGFLAEIDSRFVE